MSNPDVGAWVTPLLRAAQLIADVERELEDRDDVLALKLRQALNHLTQAASLIGNAFTAAKDQLDAVTKLLE